MEINELDQTISIDENLENNDLGEKLGVNPDFYLNVYDKQFKCHRSTLTTASPFFETRLKLTNKNKNEVEIDWQDLETFEIVLNYIYNGKIVLTKDSFGKILELSYLLQLKKLKGYCEQYIESFINLTNCLKIKELCENVKLNSKITEFCLNYINDNLMQVLDLNEFLDLSAKSVELFFTDPGTGCDNIPLINLLEVLGKWVQRNAEDRLMDYPKLLSILDWSNCPKDIFDYLKREKLFEESKLCLYFILNTMESNNINLNRFKSTYLQLKKTYETEEQVVSSNSSKKEKVSATKNLKRKNDSLTIRNLKRKNDSLTTDHQSSVEDKTRQDVSDLSECDEDVEDMNYINSDNKELMSMKTEYCVRGKKHSATLAQWKEGVKCPKCTYVGHSAPRLEQHLSKVHQEDTAYICKYCDFTCKWNREYYKHMKTHFNGPPYNCSECDYTCDRVQFILSHLMRHTDERPFACDQCSFRSRTKGNLVVHYRIHTGEKPYKCSFQFCEKRFAMKNTLDQHMATHRDDRPYLCDKCGFTTKYQSHLLSHKRIHTGNVFHCEQENCSYFSPRRSQLAAHMRSHLSIRSHICQTCERAFIERSHLIRHERIHLEDKPFKCDQCDYGSTRRDKLKEHVLKHHNQSGERAIKPRKSKKNEAIANRQSQQLQTAPQYQLVHFENAEHIPEDVREQIIAHYQNQQIDTQNVTLTIGENVYESELIVTPVTTTSNSHQSKSDEPNHQSSTEIQITNVPGNGDQEIVTENNLVEFVLV